ncbi:MAG TPA: DUF6288 domain-containing protein, partial [Phycisphaerae bacterium]|nr:DUF6288 domain-containing protein [Phycisphaerae bacterium]
LGPTGAKEWVFSRGFDTSEARQILVTEVEKGSPAEGVLATNDVILGVNGKVFESDARVALGQGITEAEKDANKGALKLLRWRQGEKKDVTVPLKVMGSYSDTSPYACPKAKRIVEQGCRVIMKRGLRADEGSLRPERNWTPEIQSCLEALALLASGNPEYLDTVKEYAHKLAPPNMKLRLRGEHEGLDTWSWGYGNVFLTEYYLATKDEYVLPAIRELARKIAIGQSEVGTWGHGFLIPRNHGNLGGYGAVNQTGLICWMSLVLAQKCGIDDPDVQKAVARSRRFFSFYVGKGSIPYGDHSPYRIQHDDNGKSASAAVTFDLLGDAAAAQFFSRMATAAYGEKELGHTGNYFGFLWGALGANRAGPAAAASYLKDLRWYYDMARRWDGSFFTTRRDNYNWDMTGLFVLHYAMPLQKLYITGKGVSQANFLTAKELRNVMECGQSFADIFYTSAPDQFYEAKSNAQLLKALGSWSPLVRQRAAKALSKKTDDVTQQLISMLGSQDMNTRYGACLALQYLAKRAAPATDELIRQLSEKDMWLRTQAAYALSCIGQPVAGKAVPELLKLAAAVDGNDPRGQQRKYLSFALFTSLFVDMPQQKGLLGDSVKEVDRELLYPVIRRLLASDDGQTTTSMLPVFKTLSTDELKSLLPEILKVAKDTPPSGEMFAHTIRLEAFRFMARNKIPEGLPAILEYARTENGWGSKTREILPLLKEYGPAARETLPQLKALQAAWKAEETAQNQTQDTRSAVAEAVIKAIEKSK